MWRSRREKGYAGGPPLSISEPWVARPREVPASRSTTDGMIPLRGRWRPGTDYDKAGQLAEGATILWSVLSL